MYVLNISICLISNIFLEVIFAILQPRDIIIICEGCQVSCANYQVNYAIIYLCTIQCGYMYKLLMMRDVAIIECVCIWMLVCLVCGG